MKASKNRRSRSARMWLSGVQPCALGVCTRATNSAGNIESFWLLPPAPPQRPRRATSARHRGRNGVGSQYRCEAPEGRANGEANLGSDPNSPSVPTIERKQSQGHRSNSLRFATFKQSRLSRLALRDPHPEPLRASRPRQTRAGGAGVGQAIVVCAENPITAGCFSGIVMTVEIVALVAERLVSCGIALNVGGRCEATNATLWRQRAVSQH
jgi:hypothetical protein